ncbi:MAG: type II toxin-antitoxin system RelB/DinJ family antitoxin [Candidatus Cryptobacteroides sp.]
MGQVAFSIRMDSDVKKKFDELCRDFGMSANTAINIFARTVIKQERIPFDVESEKQAVLSKARKALEIIRETAAVNGVADMSLEDINAEIRKYRQEKTGTTEDK